MALWGLLTRNAVDRPDRARQRVTTSVIVTAPGSAASELRERPRLLCSDVVKAPPAARPGAKRQAGAAFAERACVASRSARPRAARLDLIEPSSAEGLRDACEVSVTACSAAAIVNASPRDTTEAVFTPCGPRRPLRRSS